MEDVAAVLNEFSNDVLARLVQLVEAPLSEPRMLWSVVPLILATFFMTLYFGKHKREELGWNTAFGNTMVFLFMAISIIREMYYSDGAGSWNNVFSNEFYLLTSIALAAAAAVLMLVTYYHVLPKRVAFFLFSAPPINVSVYVIMTIIYTGVPADHITLVAAITLFLVIYFILKMIQFFEYGASEPKKTAAAPEEEKAKKESATTKTNKGKKGAM